MSYHKENPKDERVYATSNGTDVQHGLATQVVGHPGPLLVQDYHFFDLISHFDRERIPERVVHAKGAGALGTFKCTNPIPQYTMAKMFGEAGYTCDIAARFSTVGGESGSPDSVRDVRGFSVKFYTEEGNVDWVFNNTPVFFLRDPAKFVPFIHTQKRDPQTHLNHLTDSTMFWDYFVTNPEAMHQVTYLFGDRGIPKSYRNMNGYSGHTFVLTNEKSESFYCQIHLLTQQGIDYLTQEEGDQLAGTAPDSLTRDLFEAIHRGEFPRWKVMMQIVPIESAEEVLHGVNVFDLTKTWSHKDAPLIEVGEFELNKNPENYFQTIEQLAFSPSHLPPGIEPSLDPVLQGRLFSYNDTHRHRLGTNFNQIPVNSLKPEVEKQKGSLSRDGAMCMSNQGNYPNYFSSVRPINLNTEHLSKGKCFYQLNQLNHVPDPLKAFHFLWKFDPEVDFAQPRKLLMEVMPRSEGAHDRFVTNVAGHMSRIQVPEVANNMLIVWSKIDYGIAEKIYNALKEMVEFDLVMPDKDTPLPYPKQAEETIQDRTPAVGAPYVASNLYPKDCKLAQECPKQQQEQPNSKAEKEAESAQNGQNAEDSASDIAVALQGMGAS